MLYMPGRRFTDAVEWREYTPSIEIAEQLCRKLADFIAYCGCDPLMFHVHRDALELEQDYAYASVETWSGGAIELIWNSEKYMLADAAGEWCFYIPVENWKDINNEVLAQLGGEGFVQEIANILEGG